MRLVLVGFTAIAMAIGVAGEARAKCEDAAAVAFARGEVATTCQCDGFANHGQYVKCAAGVAKLLADAGTLPKNCKGSVVMCAARSTCGKPGFVTCCRTDKLGKTRCSTKKDADKCTAPKGGTACVSLLSSCCDACGTGSCAPAPTPTPPAPTPTAAPTPPPTPEPHAGAHADGAAGLCEPGLRPARREPAALTGHRMGWSARSIPSGPYSKSPDMTQRSLLRMLALLGLLLPAAGCEQRTTTVLTGHAVHGRDVVQLAIGRSTRDDVERLLGAPDERAEDGALVYRANAVRRTEPSVAGFALATSEEVVSRRSTTFRFEGEVLARICRERS